MEERYASLLAMGRIGSIVYTAEGVQGRVTGFHESVGTLGPRWTVAWGHQNSSSDLDSAEFEAALARGPGGSLGVTKPPQDQAASLRTIPKKLKAPPQSGSSSNGNKSAVDKVPCATHSAKLGAPLVTPALPPPRETSFDRVRNFKREHQRWPSAAGPAVGERALYDFLAGRCVRFRPRYVGLSGPPCTQIRS